MLKRDAVFFAVGGVGYGLIEILWRGHTHPTMLLAGGLCFVMFSRIAESFASAPLICKAVMCAAAVTCVELAFGLVFNVILGLGVWDYSDEPYNFMGQICPTFAAMWCALGAVFIPIAEAMNRRLRTTEL